MNYSIPYTYKKCQNYVKTPNSYVHPPKYNEYLCFAIFTIKVRHFIPLLLSGEVAPSLKFCVMLLHIFTTWSHIYGYTAICNIIYICIDIKILVIYNIGLYIILYLCLRIVHEWYHTSSIYNFLSLLKKMFLSFILMHIQFKYFNYYILCINIPQLIH